MSVLRGMWVLPRSHIVLHMTESDENSESTESSMKKPGVGIALGMAIGLPIGAGAGMLLFDNVGVGVALGLALGVAFGAGFESSWKSEKPEKGETPE